VWGICTVIWRITETDAYINKLALIVVVFSGLQTLVNFNPLIKLDGYYMLTDLLEVPNLRGKALRSLWDWIAGNGKSSWSIREKRAQLIYGAASAVFSISLLVYVYASLYTWATSSYALAGLVVFGIFANFTLRKALVEPMEGVKAVAARASKKRYRNLAIVVVALLLAVFVRWELKITAKVTLYPREESSVKALTPGVVVAVLVKEGDVVHKGQVLARLSDLDFEKNDTAQDYFGQLGAAREQLKVMRNGTRRETIEVQEALIKGKEVELSNVYKNEAQYSLLRAALAERKFVLVRAQQDAERTKSLFDRGLISKDEYEKSDSAMNAATESVRAASEAIRALDEKTENDAARIKQEIAERKKNLALMMAGSRPDEIQKQEAEVKRLEGMYDYVASRLKQTDITARIDGVVTTEYVERKFGTNLNAGEELMKLVDTSTITAELQVAQKDLADIQKGFPVRIQMASFPTRYFDGKVDYISELANTVDDQKMVKVRTYLSNRDGVLKPELTGTAKIYAGKRRIIEIMTRGIWKWIRTEFWSLRP